MTRRWYLDVWGVHDSGEPEDNLFMRKFNESVTYEGPNYTVALPWKIDHSVLPTNYILASRRLRSCLKKVRETEKILVTYHDFFKFI